MSPRPVSLPFAGLVGSIRTLGLANYLLYGLDRIGAISGLPFRVFRYLFVAQPVAPQPRLPARRGSAIEVRVLGPGDPGLAGLPLDDKVLRHRFGQETICFGAFQDGAVIGCLWLGFGAYDEDEVRCRFVLHPADRVVWDYDVYVKPESRSGFAFLKLWDSANAYLRARGFAWSVSRISAFNPGSIQSHGSLGASVFGNATYFRVGTMQLSLSSTRPFLYLSRSDKQIPVMTLSADKFE